MMGSAPSIIGATRTVSPYPLPIFLYEGWANYAAAAFGIFMILYAIRVFVYDKYFLKVDELAMIEEVDQEDDETG